MDFPSGSSNGSGAQVASLISGEQRRVGLVYDERMCKHSTPRDEDHPENPDRVRAIWNKLLSAGISQRCVVFDAKEAKDTYVAEAHTNNHINLIKTISSKKMAPQRNRMAAKYNSIYFNEGSSEAAYLAAGSVLEAAEKVAKGELNSAFAIVRPPGHHAEENQPMGFCLFNNIAIATRFLLNQKELGIKKILIVDWDVHHGNGTQKMFYQDPRVLFFSVHRHEFGSFYPAGDDGHYIMMGEGAGAGYNINVPWENGQCGDADYIAVWDHILIPVAREFNPDIILISAGFDAAIGDPLGGCRITPHGYSIMLRKLMEFSKGKIVMALEGGYNFNSLANSVLACVEVLLEDKPIAESFEVYPFESTWSVIKAVREELSSFWLVLAEKFPEKLTSRVTPRLQIYSSQSDDEYDDGPSTLSEDLQEDATIPLSKLKVSDDAAIKFEDVKPYANSQAKIDAFLAFSVVERSFVVRNLVDDEDLEYLGESRERREKGKEEEELSGKREMSGRGESQSKVSTFYEKRVAQLELARKGRLKRQRALSVDPVASKKARMTILRESSTGVGVADSSIVVTSEKAAVASPRKTSPNAIAATAPPTETVKSSSATSNPSSADKGKGHSTGGAKVTTVNFTLPSDFMVSSVLDGTNLFPHLGKYLLPSFRERFVGYPIEETGAHVAGLAFMAFQASLALRAKTAKVNDLVSSTHDRENAALDRAKVATEREEVMPKRLDDALKQLEAVGRAKDEANHRLTQSLSMIADQREETERVKESLAAITKEAEDSKSRVESLEKEVQTLKDEGKSVFALARLTARAAIMRRHLSGKDPLASASEELAVYLKDVGSERDLDSDDEKDVEEEVRGEGSQGEASVKDVTDVTLQIQRTLYFVFCRSIVGG